MVAYQNTKTFFRRLSSKLEIKTVLCTYVISDLKGEEIVGIFYKKELQKPNQKEFKFRVVINYVKWKGYNSSFNILIDKKDIV